MQLELCMILYMFFIRCLKVPDASNTFPLQSYVHFSEGNTRSSTHLMLKHSLSKSNVTGHLYFNRLPRLWNSLPPINLDHFIPTIRNQLLQVFWTHFESQFLSTNPCSFHYCCPCAKCVCSSIVTNFSTNYRTSSFLLVFHQYMLVSMYACHFSLFFFLHVL